MARLLTAHEILGLPRDSLPTQIRSRYRMLARRYRRDSPVQELLQDGGFLEIVRAYLLLESERRRDYERDVRAAVARREDPPPMPDLLASVSAEDKLLMVAEVALWRGQHREAARLVGTVLEKNRKNAPGWALLGEILQAEQKLDQAITMYSFATQFDPTNQRYWDLLNEATAIKEGRERPKPREEAPTIVPRSLPVWGLILATFILIGLTIVWLIPRMGPEWQWGIPPRLLLMGACDGFVLGLVLAGTDVLRHFDDELVSYSVPFIGVEMAPLGVYIIPAGLAFFWPAIVFYFIIVLLDEYISASVVLALICTAALTLLFSFVVYPAASPGILAIGAPVIFLGLVLGWMLGSIRGLPWRRKVKEA